MTEESSAGFKGAWRHRRWRWLLGSFAVSMTGDFLYSVALVVVLIEGTGSVGWVAAAAVLRVLAYVILGPFGGAIADRFSRRWLMVVLDTSRFLVMLAVAAVIWADGSASAVVALTVLNSVLTVPYRAAAVAATPHVVDEDDLAAAITRLRSMGMVRDLSPLAEKETVLSERPAAPIKRFLIRFGDRFRVVEPKDIAYIHSLEKNTFLRTREGRDLPLDESLDRLEPQLDPEKFFRLNRQIIVHFQSIKELLAYSKSRVKVLMEPPYGEDAVVSSERSAEFKRWLAGS